MYWKYWKYFKICMFISDILIFTLTNIYQKNLSETLSINITRKYLPTALSSSKYQTRPEGIGAVEPLEIVRWSARPPSVPCWPSSPRQQRSPWLAPLDSPPPQPPGEKMWGLRWSSGRAGSYHGSLELLRQPRILAAMEQFIIRDYSTDQGENTEILQNFKI